MGDTLGRGTSVGVLLSGPTAEGAAVAFTVGVGVAATAAETVAKAPAVGVSAGATTDDCVATGATVDRICTVDVGSRPAGPTGPAVASSDSASVYVGTDVIVGMDVRVSMLGASGASVRKSWQACSKSTSIAIHIALCDGGGLRAGPICYCSSEAVAVVILRQLYPDLPGLRQSGVQST